jgi:hypothetical protein
MVNNMTQEQILEKVQKLLSLASSDNENEARIASAKASELLLKYNLSLSQVKDFQPEYEKKSVSDELLAFQAHHLIICSLVQEFFMVKVLVTSTQGKFNRRTKVISFIGTQVNIQVTEYIYTYLDRMFPVLFDQYRRKNYDAKLTDRKAYYVGLSRGICENLEATKFKVEQEAGLVIVEDANLKKYVASISTKTVNSRSSYSANPEALNAGMEAGRNLKIQRGISSSSSSDSIKNLNYKGGK